MAVGKNGLVDNHFDPFGFDTFHHPLYRRRSEIVGARFHQQAVDTDGLGILFYNRIRNKIFSRGIGIDNGTDQVIGHLIVIGQQLF